MATPDSWKRAQVGELFDLQLGKMLNKAATEQQPQFPYLGNKEVRWGRFDFSDLRRMYFSANEQRKFKLEPGDLLVCEGGEVGRAAVWRGEFDCFYQKAVHRLRATSEAVTPRFMFQFMRFAADNGLLRDLTSQSSIAHLTMEKLALLEVPLPPLPEQRKIAAILSAVDEVIEKTEAVIESLQALKKAMMHELLTRGIPGRHTRFKQTEIGEIPDEWEVVELGAVFKLTSGKGIPVRQLGPETEDNCYPVFGGNGLVGYTSAAIVEGDTVVIGRVGAYCGAVHRTHGSAWVSDNALYVRELRRPASIGFLTDWLTHLDLTRLRKENAQPLVSQQPIHSLRAAFPSLPEQEEIAERIRAADTRLLAEHQALDATRQAKAALMSVLLTGQLRVTHDEDAA